MAIQVGPDGFLQLVVGGRLLEAQAQVALQVLVQLVSWKEQAQVNKRGVIRANGRGVSGGEMLSGAKSVAASLTVNEEGSKNGDLVQF